MYIRTFKTGILEICHLCMLDYSEDAFPEKSMCYF